MRLNARVRQKESGKRETGDESESESENKNERSLEDAGGKKGRREEKGV